MRAFVAVEMSDQVRQALGALIERLRTRSGGIKWVEPQNIHLTLKFLGAVPDERVSDVVGILQVCVQSVGAFQLDLGGIGGFPDLKRPRVLFVDAKNTPAYARELARLLDERMARIGVPREERPFKCHITLGRVRTPRLMPELAGVLATASVGGFGTVDVREVVLMRSELTPKGPNYTVIERVALAGNTTP